MEKRGPVFEKSNSVENVYNMRLTALLRELVRDGGFKGASEALDLDQRTVAAAYRRGVLSRRVRTALERGLQEGEGSAAAVQRERNDGLEKRLEDVEARVEAGAGRFEELAKDVSRGFSAVQGDVKALGDEQAQHGRRVAALEGGGARDEGEEESNAAGEPAKRRSAPWRDYPDLLTLEPAEGDEEVFGGAWPLIVEWRELKNAHPLRGKGFEWLTDHERLLSMELALLEEHGLTLPPEKRPLRGFDRNGQVNWRRSALSDTRRALLWRRRLRRVVRAVTFGLWRRLRAAVRSVRGGGFWKKKFHKRK